MESNVQCYGVLNNSCACLIAYSTEFGNSTSAAERLPDSSVSSLILVG